MRALRLTNGNLLIPVETAPVGDTEAAGSPELRAVVGGI
jgi:hypothetical protein